MPKIVQFNIPPGGTHVQVADNVEVALDIETTAGEDFILIDSETGAENMVLCGANFPVLIGSNQRGPRMRDGHGSSAVPGFPVYTFRGDTNTGMTHLGTSNDDALALVAGGVEGVRITESGDATTTQINGKALIKGDLSDALQGTVSASSGSTAVTGSGTAFLTEIFEGSAIKLGSEIHSVAAVASDTALTLDAVTAGAHSGITAYTDNSPIFQVQSGDSRSLLEANNRYVRINGRGGPSTREPQNSEVALYIDGAKPVSGNTDSVGLEINCEGSNGAQIILTNGGNYLGRFMAQSNLLYIGTQYVNQDVVLYPGSRKIMSIRGDEYAAVLQDSDIKLYQNEASAAGQEICFYKSRNTTDESAATIVNDGDVLGALKFKGANGDAFSEGARIEAAISGTPGNDDLPTSLTFYTTPDGSETPAVNARIEPNGDFGVRKLKGISGLASDLHVSGAGAAGDLKINNGDGRDVIIYNGSSTQTAHFDASAALLHLTGPGGSTGDAANTGAAAPTLYLESSTGNSQDRCALQMNADGNSGCMIDMYYSGDRKMVIVAQDTEQSITAEDTLVIKSESDDSTRISVGASNFNVQDLATIHAKNSADANGASYEFRKSRHAGDGSHTIVNDDDVLGEIKFSGSDGNSYATGAKIFARVNGSPSDGDMPTELVFETTPDGSETPSTRLTIGHNGVMASTTDSASCFAFKRTGQADALEIRSSNGVEFNTAGVKSIKFMQSYREIADFNEETLILENLNYPYSGTNGGLWIDLPNTCTSSGSGNRTIACTAHGLQAGDAVALPSGNSNVYEVFKVASRDSANQFTVDSDLTNSISSAVGNTDGNKLVVKSGHSDTRFQVKGSGNTQITSGQRQLELFQEDGNVRWYYDDTQFVGMAGSGSGRWRLTTDSASGSYLRYGSFHLGDEITDITTAVLHPITGADIASDIPTVKVEQLNTTHNQYAIEINNTGSGDSIHDDSGAKLTAAGVWTDASDVLHKEDIVDIPYGLAEVLQMQPRKYKLKKTGEEDIGFISQEMEAIIPEVVFGDDAVMQDKVVDVTARPAKLDENGEEIDPAREEKARFNVPTGGKSLSYSHLTAVLVRAVQELTERVKELENG